jgi:hypothetical protein
LRCIFRPTSVPESRTHIDAQARVQGKDWDLLSHGPDLPKIFARLPAAHEAAFPPVSSIHALLSSLHLIRSETEKRFTLIFAYATLARRKARE